MFVVVQQMITPARLQLKGMVASFPKCHGTSMPWRCGCGVHFRSKLVVSFFPSESLPLPSFDMPSAFLPFSVKAPMFISLLVFGVTATSAVHCAMCCKNWRVTAVISSQGTLVCIWSNARTTFGAVSTKRAFFVEELKGSPDTVSNLCMFFSNSSSAISYGLSSEGNMLALRSVFVGLCIRRAVFGAYRVASGRHASAPVKASTLQITDNAGPLTLITKT